MLVGSEWLLFILVMVECFMGMVEIRRGAPGECIWGVCGWSNP